MLAMTITMNWVLFKRNSFYGDIQLQGKSNTHPPPHFHNEESEDQGS